MSKNTSNLGTEPYKGVRDFYPEQMAEQKYIFNTWRKVVEKYGYIEYSASILEPAELYKAKSGEEIINEQTYTFTDRGDREVTLRPEMTPTVARMIAGRRREIGFPARWYSIPNLFRYERPQRGRGREHWQLNVDSFGLSGIEAEIEGISIASDIMKSFGATDSDFTIKISSRKLMNAIFNNWYELDEQKSIALQKLIDKKSKMEAEIFAGEAEKIVGVPFEFLNISESSDDYQEAMAFTEIREAKEELDTVIASLKERGIANVQYDETLIRGFDYYTGIIFEVFDTDPQNNRSLFGGGRYDDLLSLFGGEKIPAFGFGMGDMTISDFLETRKLLPRYRSVTDAMICVIDESAAPFADKVAAELRTQNINIAVNYTYRSPGDQIKSALKQAIPYAIIIGEKEATTQSYEIKDLANEAVVPNILSKEK
ncbi:MAG: histidine--tRNA ligase [Patescibacteria group bacterium]